MLWQNEERVKFQRFLRIGIWEVDETRVVTRHVQKDYFKFQEVLKISEKTETALYSEVFSTVGVRFLPCQSFQLYWWLHVFPMWFILFFLTIEATWENRVNMFPFSDSFTGIHIWTWSLQILYEFIDKSI